MREIVRTWIAYIANNNSINLIGRNYHKYNIGVSSGFYPIVIVFLYIDTFNRAFHAIYRLREIYDARFYHSQKLMKRAIKF